MTVLVCQIICDRKASSQHSGSIDAICNIDYPNYEVYINIQQQHTTFQSLALYQPMLEKLNDSGITYNVDSWCYKSTWKPGPTYDQDIERLMPICIARNMALEYASRREDIEKVLFVDADVIIEPDGLKKLMSRKLPFIGGLVPGRGAHKHVSYIFFEEERKDGLIKCSYGTCGYMLIDRSVFSLLRFRIGQASHTKTPISLSEDPNFCIDAKTFLGIDFYIDETVKAKHWDDPENPFTADQASPMEVVL